VTGNSFTSLRSLPRPYPSSPLSSELFLWRRGESSADVIQDERLMKRIREEVADIFIYLLFLCHDLEINITSTVFDKLEKNRQKYPPEEYRGRFKEP